MGSTDRIALGRVVMHTRERLMAIEPRGKGLVAYTLRSKTEVRSAAEAFEDIPDHKPDAQMVEIAEKIIQQLEGPFDPSEFNDRYEDALRKLIAEKEKGAGRKVTVEEPQDTNVVDLMEALRRSLGHGATARRPPAKSAAKKTAAKKAAAHKTPAKERASR
jgi:DNA end-binding protein Ku